MTGRSLRGLRLGYAAFLLSTLMVVLVGCGSGTAKVKGKVTYKGETLGQGTVGFLSADGKRSAMAEIDANGNYEMLRAPVGEVKVTVIVPPAPSKDAKSAESSINLGGKAPKDAAAMPKLPGTEDSKPKGKHVPVPDKYKDPETSGLTRTVTTGSQTIDIDLTD